MKKNETTLKKVSSLIFSWFVQGAQVHLSTPWSYGFVPEPPSQNVYRFKSGEVEWYQSVDIGAMAVVQLKEQLTTTGLDSTAAPKHGTYFSVGSKYICFRGVIFLSCIIEQMSVNKVKNSVTFFLVQFLYKNKAFFRNLCIASC